MTKQYKSPKYFAEKANEYGIIYNLEKNPVEMEEGHNDEIDMFRHAYMQAYMTIEYGKNFAKIIGDIYEKWGTYTESQGAQEYNMDLWNNEIGRRIGEEVKNEISHFRHLTTQKMLEDMIAEKIYKNLQEGRLIKNLKDKRKYSDLQKGKSTGYASQLEPFTRQQIGRMTSEEFEQNEDLIMEQLRKGLIRDETEVVKSKKQSNGNNTANGKWVTINGNHVLIKD